jgi:hypothetical protein
MGDPANSTSEGLEELGFPPGEADPEVNFGGVGEAEELVDGLCFVTSQCPYPCPGSEAGRVPRTPPQQTLATPPASTLVYHTSRIAAAKDGTGMPTPRGNAGRDHQAR